MMVWADPDADPGLATTGDAARGSTGASGAQPTSRRAAGSGATAQAAGPLGPRMSSA